MIPYRFAFMLYVIARISLRIVMGKEKRNAYFNEHKIRISTFFLRSQIVAKNGIMAYARRNSDDYELLFVPREQEIIKYLNLSPNDTFLDIGANVGFYTLRALNLYPNANVIAIEAHPETFKALRKNIGINNFNPILINKAVYHTKQTLNLYQHGGWSGISSIYRKSDQIISIEGDTLDNILEEQRIDKVDVIKMDIEGAEVDALLGAHKSLANCRMIIVEIHNDNLEKVKSILEERGFQIEVLNKGEYVVGKR